MVWQSDIYLMPDIPYAGEQLPKQYVWYAVLEACDQAADRQEWIKVESI